MFGSREDFFRRGFTTAVLNVNGKEPDSSEEFTMLVRVGRNSSKHSKRRDVGGWGVCYVETLSQTFENCDSSHGSRHMKMQLQAKQKHLE